MTKSMRILIVTQWFDPEPFTKGMLFARELAARGHSVQVLTGFPNYPGGKVYDGYRIRPWSREHIDGVHVIRVALYPSHDRSPLRRALNYLSFAFAAALLGVVLVDTPDVIYAYHPPITVGLSAAFIGMCRRAPLVCDIQDPWPDTIAATGMVSNRKVLAALSKLCRLLYRRSTRLVALSPGVRARLMERGVPQGKIDVTYNWCDDSDPCDESESSVAFRHADPSGAGQFVILFAGTMGLAQDLDFVISAAAICQVELPSARFVLMGSGVDRERIEGLSRKRNLHNLAILPAQPMAAMRKAWAQADVLLVHLKDDRLLDASIPSKTQAYMAAGKPILMAARGDAAALVERAKAGIVCTPGDARSIANAVKHLAAMTPERLAALGAAGKDFYRRELSLPVGVSRFEQTFRAVLEHA
jgi:glycosyltransferase involved in cell wall biosynthesis